MANIAVIGYGVVGSGVVEVIETNKDSIKDRAGTEVQVKYILDIRDFKDDPNKEIFIREFEVIEENPWVDVVVECIGGITPALDFIKRSLCAGKHVVTSNKELVSRHGAELIALAKENKVSFQFEASVGGGIPVIRPLHQCLAANRVTGMEGILNGTTNFILTRMGKDAMSFGDALALAQELGYAEADPSADVDGLDACRKISILASLAFGRQVDPDRVTTEGIRNIEPVDTEAAAKGGYAIKLIAFAEQGEDKKVKIGVGPTLVPRDNQLAIVEDVFNAVMVHGDMLGDVVFYGRGAGKLPTASAVVADVIDALKNPHIHDTLTWEENTGGPFEESDSDDSEPRYLRLQVKTVKDRVAAEEMADKVLSSTDGEDLVIITKPMTKTALLKQAQSLGNIKNILKII